MDSKGLRRGCDYGGLGEGRGSLDSAKTAVVGSHVFLLHRTVEHWTKPECNVLAYVILQKSEESRCENENRCDVCGELIARQSY